jgi:hypothetical protein
MISNLRWVHKISISMMIYWAIQRFRTLEKVGIAIINTNIRKLYLTMNLSLNLKREFLEVMK